MKKFILFILLLPSITMTAQNTIFRQWNIEMSYASREYYTKNYPNFTFKSKFSSIACNYRYSLFFESGLYYSLRINNANLIFQQKIYLTPLLFKEGLTKLNIYIPIGYSSLLLKSGFSNTGKLIIQADGLRFGIGTSLNFKNKMGIFSEFYIHKSNYRVYKPYLQVGLKYSWDIKEKQPKTE